MLATRSPLTNEMLHQLLEQAAQMSTSLEELNKHLVENFNSALGDGNYVMWLTCREKQKPGAFSQIGNRLTNTAAWSADAGTLPGFGQNYGITCIVSWR